jgi:hypothetical protein
MEDRETPQMCKYGESKMTRIMMVTVPHVTSGLGLRKFQADGFLFDRVYMVCEYSSWLESATHVYFMQTYHGSIHRVSSSTFILYIKNVIKL